MEGSKNVYTVACYIYMRNFANLCIMVWIHMNMYFVFSKFDYFMYFLVIDFLIRFFLVLF
jgi:hypothetical protein